MTDMLALWPCAALIGYCLGCLDMAWILGFLRGIDVKSEGTKNAGASNAVLTMGLGAGIVTAVWDIGKAVLAYCLMRYAFQAPHEISLAAAGVAVLGHIFPFWLYFDGGKGLAPYIGFLACLDWRAALATVFGGLLLALFADKFVVLTACVILMAPTAAFLVYGNAAGILVLALSVIVTIRHAGNVRNLIDGSEPGIRNALERAIKKRKDL